MVSVAFSRKALGELGSRMTSQAEAPCSISHHARTSGQAPSFFPTKHLFSIEWPTCGPCQSDSVTSNPCYLLPAPAPPFVCISSWCLRVDVVCGQKVILAIACSHIPVLPSGSSKVEGTFRENLNLLRRFFSVLSFVPLTKYRFRPMHTHAVATRI